MPLIFNLPQVYLPAYQSSTDSEILQQVVYSWQIQCGRPTKTLSTKRRHFPSANYERRIVGMCKQHRNITQRRPSTPFIGRPTRLPGRPHHPYFNNVLQLHYSPPPERRKLASVHLDRSWKKESQTNASPRLSTPTVAHHEKGTTNHRNKRRRLQQEVLTSHD